MTKTVTEQIVNIQNDLDVVFAEVVKLQKKLKIAKEALSFYSDPLFMEQGETALKALKEMEGVK